MDISVDTFLKPDLGTASETVGRTTMSLDESAYQKLVEVEELLKDRSSQEMLVPVDEHEIDVSAPGDLGDLTEQKVRVFLGTDEQAGHFHLVAKRASDRALVYTEPTMIRLVAV